VEPQRLRSLALAPGRPNVTLVARPLADPLRQLPLVAGMPVWTPQTVSPSRRAESPGPIGSPGSIDMAAPLRVWVTEAMVAIHGAHPGTRLMLPLGPNARTEVVVAGVWRDYARQFGAIAIDLADYQRLSGDLRVNDLALWLAPGASADAVMTSLRSAATDSTAQLANAPAVSRLSTQGDAVRSPAAPDASAGRYLDLPAAHVPDPRRQLAHEAAVVADEQQRPVVRAQRLRQALARVEVEVVGRLVHQQQVARLDEQPRQRHARPLAARQHADLLVDVVAAEQERPEHAAHPRLPGPRVLQPTPLRTACARRCSVSAWCCA
jgi:hypothetical protein